MEKTSVTTVYLIDLGKLNLLIISLPWSKSVKQTVESKSRLIASLFVSFRTYFWNLIENVNKISTLPIKNATNAITFI
jgi:hypothetical protein